MVEQKKKSLGKIVNEITTKLVEEGLSAREILMILREIENDAIIALLMGQLVQNAQQLQETTDNKG